MSERHAYSYGSLDNNMIHSEFQPIDRSKCIAQIKNQMMDQLKSIETKKKPTQQLNIKSKAEVGPPLPLDYTKPKKRVIRTVSDHHRYAGDPLPLTYSTSLKKDLTRKLDTADQHVYNRTAKNLVNSAEKHIAKNDSVPEDKPMERSGRVMPASIQIMVTIALMIPLTIVLISFIGSSLKQETVHLVNN